MEGECNFRFRTELCFSGQIKELVNETLGGGGDTTGGEGAKVNATSAGESKTNANGFQAGLQQILVMFRQPHLRNSLQAYGIQFGILFG